MRQFEEMAQNDMFIDNGMDDSSEMQRHLESCIKIYQDTNKTLADLLLIKEKATREIIAALNHTKDGQKTYEFQCWKIEVKTPLVYSLDKKKYEKALIPHEFNPVKESITYTIDKKLCDKFLNEAPDDIRDVLFDLIEVKPGKANVLIKDNV
mgnify:CR=1 FL=1